MKTPLPPNHRILLVDDNPTIHDDFRRVLLRDRSGFASIDAAAAAALGGPAPQPPPPQALPFTLDSALQGEEALEMVKSALAVSQPYALAFVDMRMPPGWDGLTTIARLWEVDPKLQIVICTAFSDRSWTEIQQTLAVRDSWLVVKKPFDEIEVLQLAHALTEKWNLARAAELRMGVLEILVQARTEELERVSRVKDEFLANVSHEMLTPLTSVAGALDLLSCEELDPDTQEILAGARAGADSLHRLIQQVLTFNKATAGTIRPVQQAGDVRQWLAGVESSFATRASAKGLQLAVAVAGSVPPRVAAVSNIVVQVLTALVDNAIKFTPAGRVSIDVAWSGAPAHRRLQFAVADTGVGLSPAELDRIAIPFAQIDGAANRQHSGIGLGLPLARRLLALVDSELQIQSKPGVGTTAIFSVPATTLDEAAETPLQTSPAA